MDLRTDIRVYIFSTLHIFRVQKEQIRGSSSLQDNLDAQRASRERTFPQPYMTLVHRTLLPQGGFGIDNQERFFVIFLFEPVNLGLVFQIMSTPGSQGYNYGYHYSKHPLSDNNQLHL